MKLMTLGTVAASCGQACSSYTLLLMVSSLYFCKKEAQSQDQSQVEIYHVDDKALVLPLIIVFFTFKFCFTFELCFTIALFILPLTSVLPLHFLLPLNYVFCFEFCFTFEQLNLPLNCSSYL